MDAEQKVVTLAEILTEPAIVAGLREQGPVHRASLPDGTPLWVVIGYDEAIAALSDPRLSVAAMTAAGVIGSARRAAARADEYRPAGPHALASARVECLRCAAGGVDAAVDQ
jgi:hypothetical protein